MDPDAFLRAMGFADGTLLEQVTGGADTQIWKVQVENEPYALRVFRPDQAGSMEREVRHLKIAANAGIPVPSVKAHRVVDGCPVMLIQWLSGETLGPYMANHPEKALALAFAFGRTHAEMHQKSPVFAETWLDKIGDGWQRAVFERLHHTESRLIHLDFHPLNVMTDGDRITGIFDWTNSEIADPRFDVARTWAIFRLSPMIDRSDPAFRAYLNRMLREYRRGYADIAGPPRQMAPFMAVIANEMISEIRHHERVNGRLIPPVALTRIERWVRRFRSLSNNL